MSDHIFSYWDDHLPGDSFNPPASTQHSASNESLSMEEVPIERYYGMVMKKNALLISPTKEQLLHYFRDYGFESIDDIIEELGYEDMLRDWYVNTDWLESNWKYQSDNGIYPMDWEHDDEEVQKLSKDEWESIYKDTHG